MTQTRAAAHRKHTHRNTKGVGRLLRGLGVSILTTLVGVALFSLLMQWVKPSDGAIRVFNQVLKLLSIALGVWSAVGRGGEKGLMRGAAVGLGYMGLGVALYAILSGQQAAFSSYLADLAMGVAGGGIVGMILSNISAK
ncbi:MAG TPA: TIGR04086 family membrane protein [Candidatus Egerieenecus merdigallinarum]|nr:TIGR04086 family membrane protein [Candidatus Egerieenecus merdigallinarum]